MTYARVAIAGVLAGALVVMAADVFADPVLFGVGALALVGLLVGVDLIPELRKRVPQRDPDDPDDDQI